MAYDEYMAERVRRFFDERKVGYEEKKMMGGLCFMVDGKMCCGMHYDKKQETDLLMCRIGEDAQKKVAKKKGCQPMTFTGRTMKGFVFVTGEGFDTDKQMDYWLQLCLDFNPLAKASKKKKKTK